MKTIVFKNIATLLTLVVLLMGCSEEDPSIGAAPSAADAAFTFAPTPENDNIINFTSTTSAFLKKWDFGNGSSSTGNTARAIFPTEGTYTVTLTVYTNGGSISSQQEVVIAETDPTLLDLPVYNLLTGGSENVAGKRWVIDATRAGHLGVGPSAGTWAEWYNAAANEKADAGFYDDIFVFSLTGFKYQQITNGDVFVNGAHVSDFAISEPAGGDFKAQYPGHDDLTWSISGDEGNYQLSIAPPGFMGYYAGTRTYQILTLTENELYVRCLDSRNADLAWYMRFVPEGHSEPEPEPEPKPYKIENIQTDFESASLSFVNDSEASIITYDNPAPVPINTSSKVGRYVKTDGAGGQFGNVQIQLDYRMDIRERNVFKMKVFIPSYNDYTKEGGESWQSYNTLQKQVAIKLQNSDLGGNAYTTQQERKHTDLPTNEWIELTFDFSDDDTKNRDDFDKVVIQIGGEAIHAGGIFFIDDLQLLP